MDHARRTTCAVLLAGTAIAAPVGQAFARTEPSSQTAAPSQPNGVVPAQSATGADNDPAPQVGAAAGQDIVVTGSRVITNGNNSPTPLTVISVDQIQATHPSIVFEGLIDTPQFSGSRGTTATNPGDSGPNNGNASALGLRGLGSVRTLVLLDGQRLPPTQANGFVDVNQIPQLLLQRVDVVTGGASAVYGSDAVAGVVNFVIDRKFNGLKAEGQYGISTYGDNRAWDAGIAYGASFADGRGHFEASFNFHDDDGVLHRADRADFAPRYTTQGNGCPAGTTPCVPYFLTTNGTISNMTFGGKIVGPAANPYLNQQFAANGVLSAFNAGTAIPGSIIQLGGDGAYDTVTSLKASLNLKQYFERLDYDVTDSIHFHAMGSAATSHTLAFEKDNRLAAVVLSTSNAFLSPAYQTALANAKLTTFTFSKLFRGYDPAGGAVSLIPGKSADFYGVTKYANAGLEGTLGKFHWDIDYTHGDAQQHSVENANINNGRLFAALDAVVSPTTGQIVCQVSTTANAGLYPGCVPLNIFGPTSETQAAANYVVQKTNTYSTSIINDVSGAITGPAFNDWAGPVNVALSGNWRRQSYVLTSDALPVSTDPLDCTGLRYNCTPGNVALGTGTSKWNNNTYSNRPRVTQTVSEVALEAGVPLLKDLSFAQDVSVDLAGRYAHYVSVGNPIITQPELTKTSDAWTWKAGLDWHVIDQVTIRATRSRDIRAPNLDELFGAGSLVANAGNTDLLLPTTSTGVPFIQTGGNPNLQPEIAQTFTAGVVLKPFSNLSVSVDYFHIKVDNYIQGVAGYTPAIQQACYNAIRAGGTSFYCTLQERGGGGLTAAVVASPTSANSITRWYSIPLNIAQQRTYGYDVELNYRMRLLDRPISARVLVAYQPHLTYIPQGLNPLEAAGVLSNSSGVLGGGTGGGTGALTGKLRFTVSGHYELTDRFSFDWLTKWRSGMTDLSDPTTFQDGSPRSYAPPRSVSDITFTYKLPLGDQRNAAVYLNVLNFLNAPPSHVAVPGAGAVDPGLFGGSVVGDDPTGRFFNMGFRLRY